MQSQPEKHLYEYAVIRYVPRVEREEFVNVGLIMMCKRRRWLKVAIHLDPDRLTALYPDADLDTLRQQLQSFTLIAAGPGNSSLPSSDPHLTPVHNFTPHFSPIPIHEQHENRQSIHCQQDARQSTLFQHENPIAALDPHERFRWLTAVRSASIATSRPHPGITTDLDKTFTRLTTELLL